MATPDHPGPGSDRRPTAKRASYRSGFLFGTLNFFAVSGVGLVSTVITSHLYGVRIIGQFALVWAPVAALWVLSTAKEQQALIREITGLPPRHPRVTQLFAAVFTFSWSLTAVVSSLVAVVCWFVFRGPLHAPALVAPAIANIAGYAIVTNTGWNIDSIFSAFVAGRQLFLVRLHEVLSFVIIATVLGLFWRSVWAMVIAMIGGSLTSLIHRMIAVRPFVRAHLSWEEYRAGMRVLPEPAALRAEGHSGPGRAGHQPAGRRVGPRHGGAGGCGGRIQPRSDDPAAAQGASMRITEVLYPTLVGRHTQGDGHGFDRALIDSIRYEVIGMLLIAAAIGGAAHSVLSIFGPGFGRAAPALALLSLFPALASVTVTQTQALWAIDRPGRTSVIAIVRMTITITLLVVLTPRIGIIGPAIALLAGFLPVAVLSGIALRPSLTRSLRATWPLRERFALLAAYTAGFAVAHGIEQVAPATVDLLLCLPAGIAAYAAAFLLVGGLNLRDRSRLAELLSWLRSRRESRGPQRRQPLDEPKGTRIDGRDPDRPEDSFEHTKTAAEELPEGTAGDDLSEAALP